MRVRTFVCCLATLTIVASTTPAIAGSTTPAKPTAPESVQITKADNGRVRLIQPKPGSTIARPAAVPAAAKPTAVAEAHLAKQASVLGISVGDLRPQQARRVAGNDVVRFQQTIGGVPVFAGQLVTVLDKNGNLELLTGETIARPGEAFPKVSAATGKQLAATAKRAVIERERLAAGTKLAVKPTERRWYVPELIGAPAPDARKPRPVQEFKVTGPELSYLVLVDVITKRTELLSSQRRQVLNRVICDVRNETVEPPSWCYGVDPSSYTRLEGQVATGIPDVDLAYDYLGDASSAFANHLSIDLTDLVGHDFEDGVGKSIRASVRTCSTESPECPWHDSYWSGFGNVVLGDGMVTDDVVGHELAHGVTAQLTGLYYNYQSGAIDEGLADFWGELVDLSNNSPDDTPENRWKFGEGSGVGVLRDAANPTAHGQPDRMTSPQWKVASYRDDLTAAHTNAGVFSKTAFLAAEGGTFNGYTIEGIGLDKTAVAVGTMQQLLTSGADYKDIFSLLPLACRQQIGQPVAVTEADCQQIDKAVRATELYKDAPQGAPKKVTYCDAGLTQHRYREGFETRVGGWAYGFNSGNFNGWGMASDWSSPFVADGEDAAQGYVGVAGSNWAVAQREPIVLPLKAFLRFEHAYYQDSTGSGLLVEYLVTGGTWTPASTLPNVNGETVARSVLGGKKSFGNESYGYGSTRYDLSSLAGKSVRFRFRAATEGNGAYWWVDNLSVYTC